MACKFNHVLKGANECKENPAGLSNFCMIVPLDSNHVTSIEVNDEKESLNVFTNTFTTSSLYSFLSIFHLRFYNQI